MELSEDDLFLVALIFERANGSRMDKNDVLMIEQSTLSKCSAEELEALLVESIAAEPPPSYRSSAYWALGKRFNRELILTFKRWMIQELQNQEVGAVYQLLIALDNLGEPVFGRDRNGSYSSMDVSLNVRDAKTYLEKNA